MLPVIIYRKLYRLISGKKILQGVTPGNDLAKSEKIS
jgi:hypothetical protein